MVKKQETTTQEATEGQFVCKSCTSRKIYAIYVKTLGNQTTITLLCDSCGTLFPLDLIGSMQPVDQPIVKKAKKEVSYLA